MSIGSNKLLLSIYINSQDSNTLYFQLTKPCDKIVEQNKPNTTVSQLSRSNIEVYSNQSAQKRIKSPCCCSMRQKRRQSNTIIPHDKDTSITTASSSQRDGIKTNGSLNGGPTHTTKSTIKSTRLAIKNSFSQFSFFSSIMSDQDGELNSFRYPLEVKGLKMPKNKWTHLSFSVMPSNKRELAVSENC